MTIALHNIRSAWNVGAIMRTCDAVGADLILIGYTPRPTGSNLKLIQKTAIGAENTVSWQHFDHWPEVLNKYPDHTHIGIEISGRSQNIFDFLRSTTTPHKHLPTSDYPAQAGNDLIDLGKTGSISHSKNSPSKGSETLDTQKTYTSRNCLDLDKTFLWFGNEIHGLEEKLCGQLNYELHLPMRGRKESLNVASTVCAVGYLFLGTDQHSSKV